MLKSLSWTAPAMAVGPAQSGVLVGLFGGAVLFQGLLSFLGRVPQSPAEEQQAVRIQDTVSSWSVSLVTALQVGLLGFILGTLLTIYFVFKHSAGFGLSAPVQLAVANQADIHLQHPIVNHETSTSVQRPRRGSAGVLERSTTRPAGAGLV